MKNSLQFRLLVAFTCVILLTVGAVFFMTWRATVEQIQQLSYRVERMVIDRIQFQVTEYYLINNNWKGVQPLVAQIGEQFRHRIILADADGKIIADSSSETPDEHLNLENFSSTTLTSALDRHGPETGGPPGPQPQFFMFFGPRIPPPAEQVEPVAPSQGESKTIGFLF
ncbi:MAG: hypothetical protein WC541_02475, partial [Dehalococcoidia bacterium]